MNSFLHCSKFVLGPIYTKVLSKMTSTSDKDESSVKSHVSYVFSSNTSIMSEKLNGDHYLNWPATINMWVLGPKLSNHLTKKSSKI